MSKKRITMSAGTLIGDDIKNLKGEDLGTVKELMIDVLTGQISYVVVSFGGLMGMGDKLFAIPFAKFSVDEDSKVFRLDLDQDALKDAPGFDKDHWPDFTNAKWAEEIYDYYHVTPFWLD